MWQFVGGLVLGLAVGCLGGLVLARTALRSWMDTIIPTPTTKAKKGTKRGTKCRPRHGECR